MPPPQPDSFIEIANAEVHKVQNGKQELVMSGLFKICGIPEEKKVYAEIDPVTWVLAPTVSVLRYTDFSYTFEVEGSFEVYLCLVLPPTTVPDLIDALQQLLKTVSSYYASPDAIAPEALPPSTPFEERSAAIPAAAATAAAASATPSHPAGTINAEAVAKGLVKGGALVAKSIMALASYGVTGMQKAAEASKSRLAPAEQPVQISEGTQKTLECARSIARTTAKVSGKAASAVGSLTAAAAGAIAERVSSSSAAKSVTSAKVGGSSGSDLIKVGVAGLKASAAIVDALSDAAKLVAVGARETVPSVVEHKYGKDAGTAAATSMDTVVAGVETGSNLKQLHPTKIAKKVIKGAAKKVAKGAAGEGEAPAAGTAAPAVMPA